MLQPPTWMGTWEAIVGILKADFGLSGRISNNCMHVAVPLTSTRNQHWTFLYLIEQADLEVYTTICVNRESRNVLTLNERDRYLRIQASFPLGDPDCFKKAVAFMRAQHAELKEKRR